MVDQCRKQFEKTFPDVFSPNDVAFIVWQHAWDAGRECLLKEIKENNVSNEVSHTSGS